MLRKFVVIGGVARSGTNLARRIIGSHSKIAIPPAEFEFFAQYVDGKSVEEILSHRRFRKWEMAFSDFLSCEHRDVYIQALVRYARNAGKEIPGEKTPFNEFYYDIIQEWLQDFELKFIHLVRNPFDVMASHKDAPHRKNYRGIADISVYSRNWCRSVHLGLAREHVSPDGYYVLKYEDLTGDPVGTVQKLCAFLGVDLEKERMLNMVDFKGHRDNTSFPQAADGRVAEFRAIRRPESRKPYLSAAELRITGSICGELAHALGYEDDDFQSLPPERLSLGVIAELKQAISKRVSSRLPAGSGSGG
jgi:hypothetical protein